MTRITQLSMANMSLAGLQANLGSVQQLQGQAASGRRIQAPSDDPQGTAISMTLRSQQAADTQYTANADFATARLGAADTALKDLNAQFRSVRSLLIASQNGSANSDSRAAMADQITQAVSSVTALYNTQYLGRPIFGGTSNTDSAIDASGAYVGDGTAVMVRLSATTSVRVDVDGASIGADSAPGLLTQLALNVAQPTGAAQSDLDLMDTLMSTVTTALGGVGALEGQVTTTTAAVSAHSMDLTTSISHNESADLAEILTKFASQQVAYQTAVGVAAKIQQTSLLDFLR
jgi:flagellar hook-associated protein 3 FlgL